MNIEVLDKSYFAEIPIQASSTANQYFFPTLNNLDGKFTQGIRTYPVAAMTKSPAGATPANNALVNVSFLKLYVGNDVEYDTLPLMDLVTVRNSLGTATWVYNPFAIEFNNKKIIWAKSYVFVADTSLIAGAAESFVFNILYSDGMVGDKQ